MMKNLSLVILILLAAATLFADNTVAIDKWLVTNVVSMQKPLFADEENIKGESWSEKDVLEQVFSIDRKMHPKPGADLKWAGEEKLSWQEQLSEEINFKKADQSKLGLAYAAFYIETEEWMKITLELESSQLLKVWLDNDVIASKTGEDDFSEQISLETGKHKILIKCLAKTGEIEEWSISGTIKSSRPIKLSTDPSTYMTVDKLLYSEKVGGVNISYDGEYAAMTLYDVDKEEKKNNYYIDIRNSDDGELVRSYRGGMKINSLKWSPVANEFIYKTSEDGKSSLWLANIETGKNESILRDVENLESYDWAPVGDYLIYTASVKEDEEKSGVRKLKHMPDRQPGNRKVSYLFRLDMASGITEQLTFGELSTYLNDISEDGRRLIISRYHPFVTERPFSRSDYYILDIETMAMDSLFTLKWANSLQWSPDGEKILITGGVSMFDGIGNNLPDDVIPNDYDGQAFIYYVESGKVLPITKNFDPAINSAHWSRVNGTIYLVAKDRSFVSLFEYDVEKNRFSKLNTGMEVVARFDLADQEARGVYFGTSATEPYKVCTIDLVKKSFFGLKKEDYKVIYTPAKKVYRDTEFSRVKRWTFTNKDGVEIEGRYYLPPNFDASKKYPCIVYYYGGTSPVSRDFDGRYPKNYWSANGYVVYVMQPSGATGFGQEFAAKHVNEWGSIVPDEIIRGTEKFLEAHSFVDKNKLGCIGASYGGFTTESLITKTDMFAAAVSHAGISAVPSYWGEGYWGYSYGAVANATTFPWSHPEVFMENSALYHADKINTPLLMTHGTGDTNVPQGESIQLYTALKLLGKEVELLQCKDQNHFVLEYGQREKWSKSIVAWFDKHLKNDADWWNHIYEIED